jgi:lipopolysaccharide export LptBFGC system permease protein LptF
MWQFLSEHWKVMFFIIPIALSLLALCFCLVFDQEQKACMFGAVCFIVASVAGLISLNYLSSFLSTLAVAICAFFVAMVVAEKIIKLEKRQT